MSETPQNPIAGTIQDAITAAQTDSRTIDDVLPIAVLKANEIMNDFNTDAKTGLMNERSWKEGLRTTIDNAEPGSQVRVWVADLDRFKAVNDGLGHDAGDELLGLVGKAFTSTFQRSTDIMGH